MRVVPDGKASLAGYPQLAVGHLCRVRLVSLAAQRFVASVLDEAVNVHKRKKQAPVQHRKAEGYNVKDSRCVLSTEDLAEALKDVSGMLGTLALLHPTRS